MVSETSGSETMLRVFITIDTEIGTSTNIVNAEIDRHLEHIQNYVYGVTASGRFGLNFQIDTLNKYGLKAVFFVDSFLTYAVGVDPVRNIIKTIQDGGHEVQLHIHTEWLKKMSDPILQDRNGRNIKDFSLEEQQSLIARGIENMQACGIENVCAFRAGNYGANFDTLRALARNGILYDTSYNFSFLDSTCGMRTERPLLQPRKIHGNYEFPVSLFRDMPGHHRPSQLCACSIWEMVNSLKKAYEFGWYSFVIVTHTSELVRIKKQRTDKVSPNRIVIKRFEKLCSFLANNRDKFVTTGFTELVPDEIPDLSMLPVKSSLFFTAHRIAEQITKRYF